MEGIIIGGENKMKYAVRVFLFFLTFALFNPICADARKDADEKIKKVEKSKNPVEIFTTSLWLYRRGFYTDFVKLFKKAVEVDKEVNKDNRKLADILGYVKFEVEKSDSDAEEYEDEEEEEVIQRKKNQVPQSKSSAQSKKEKVYDTSIKRLEYLKSKLNADETIFEEQIVKKNVAEQKIKQEKDKIGWNFTTKLISAHFLLYTDVDLSTSISILDNLEAFFNTFYFFFYDAINFKKYKGKRITIYIFKDKQTYEDLVNKRYDVKTDNKPLDLYFHLRRNDNSLLDIKNNVVLATAETTVTIEVKGGKKELKLVDFVMSLPDIYKAVLESFLYIYVFDNSNKYAELGQCFWAGLRTYFAYLIPGEIAFTIGSYVGGEPFMDVSFTSEAISNKEIPDLKSVLTNNNFEEPMRQFKKYEPSTFMRVYITECYAIFYYLFHRTNYTDLDKILQQLSNKDNYTYNFIAKYIKSDDLFKFISNDLKKEFEKYKAK